MESSTEEVVKTWFLDTILWQCVLGSFVGLVLGSLANKGIRRAVKYSWIAPSSFLAFYILLAILAVGIGSTLGLDDFLVAFGAGIGFSWDGWFANRTQETHLSE
ncbi:MAG: hypothetical protein Q9183_006596, partial [Haloplaca sp. 2 TL-2023]